MWLLDFVMVAKLRTIIGGSSQARKCQCNWEGNTIVNNLWGSGGGVVVRVSTYGLRGPRFKSRHPQKMFRFEFSFLQHSTFFHSSFHHKVLPSLLPPLPSSVLNL